MFRLSIVFILLFSLATNMSFAIANTSTCWTPPYPLNCSDSMTPTGNLAFLASGLLDKDIFVRACSTVSEAFQLYQPDMWTATVDPLKYHISINYLYCIPNNYTQSIHNALLS